MPYIAHSQLHGKICKSKMNDENTVIVDNVYLHFYVCHSWLVTIPLCMPIPRTIIQLMAFPNDNLSIVRLVRQIFVVYVRMVSLFSIAQLHSMKTKQIKFPYKSLYH